MASDQRKAVVKHLEEELGARAPMERYWNRDETENIDFFILSEPPGDGLRTVSTIGLSDWPLLIDGEEYPTRLELIAAHEEDDEYFVAAISTAAFNIALSGWACYPGRVFAGVLGAHGNDVLTDLYFTSPLLWPELASPRKVGSHDVSWLMPIGISAAESAFAVEQGADALEDLLEREGIDFADLTRPSIL